MITVDDLDDANEDDAAARQCFADLQAKAQASGHTLTRTANGFMLKAGAVSRHAGDLRTIAALLTQKGRGT
jgi:hypothetical protein